jgi:malonyl-CoA O-methyltransferase
MALSWFKENELDSGGIRVHSGLTVGYPEVTGYTVPTLLNYGEKDMATRLLRWLLCIQRADGSFTNQYGISYIFDSGQVLRALLSYGQDIPEAMVAAEKVCEYLCRNLSDNGKQGFGTRYNGKIPETVHLYVLPPLMRAAEVLNRKDIKNQVSHCLDFYCKHSDALRLETLTHFLAYELEALIDTHSIELALPILKNLVKHQKEDGSVAAKKGVSWICSPGLAQLAVCWYKCGMWEAADRAMNWLEEHQRSSGGFLGSYGKKAEYFPDVELSWTNKYYLDAHRLRVKSFIDRNLDIFPSVISRDDGRVKAISEVLESGDKIVEIGCGKGRILKRLIEINPDIHCAGVDISSKMLDTLPPEIRGIEGSLELIPCADNSFDIVFSVEAVEHSPGFGKAIKEMVRIAKPGGWVIVIDKQKSHWGRKNCPPWERWPDLKELKKLLRKDCDRVSAEQIAYDTNSASDGLMVAWKGRKRSLLTGIEWNNVLVSPDTRDSLVERVRNNHMSEWGQCIMLATSSGENVLELGGGTGEISLQLAQAGREVSVLDLSLENLSFIKECAAELEVGIKGVAADITRKLPFGDNEFDCSWSSGLLEHFDEKTIRAILREQARVSKRTVISMVPNSACIAYRAGKDILEKQGSWKYGYEMPILSLRKEFEAVGLNSITEITVGVKQGLNFIPRNHSLRKPLSNWIKSFDQKELKSSHQGYLLVTTGIK